MIDIIHLFIYLFFRIDSKCIFPTINHNIKCMACNTYPIKDKYFYRDRIVRSIWACTLKCAHSENIKKSLSNLLIERHSGYKLNDIEKDEIWKKVMM